MYERKNFHVCYHGWSTYPTQKKGFNKGLLRETNGQKTQHLEASVDFLFTLSETNIAPENRPPQSESSIPTIHF